MKVAPEWCLHCLKQTKIDRVVFRTNPIEKNKKNKNRKKRRPEGCREGTGAS